MLIRYNLNLYDILELKLNGSISDKKISHVLFLHWTELFRISNAGCPRRYEGKNDKITNKSVA
jgi:hypothetical protein